jgi:hypothetical protein
MSMAEIGRGEEQSLAEARSGAWHRSEALQGGGADWSLEVLDGVTVRPTGSFIFMASLRWWQLRTR